MDFVHRIGVKKSELIPVSLRLRGAGSARLDLIGGLFLDVSIISSVLVRILASLGKISQRLRTIMLILFIINWSLHNQCIKRNPIMMEN